MSRERVAVLHHGFIPIYRAGFYEELARSGSREYVVFHGDAPEGSGHLTITGEPPFPNRRVPTRELHLAGRALVYQPLVREIMTGGYDAVVMAGQLRFVSNLALVPLLKARGRPVVFWGHGRYDQHEDGEGVTRLVLALNARLRARQARLADVYFAYTAGGVEQLAGAGVRRERLTIVPNTIDTDRQRELYERFRTADTAQLRRELGLRPDSKVLVYLGRVYREKRIEELLQVMPALGDDVELVVLGDGPQMPAIRAAAAGLANVRLLGAVEDQALIARYMRVALALVIPGGVGLAVNHAFALGVPVITRENRMHGPEVEYVEPGRNGLIVEGSVADFAAALRAFLASEEQQRDLAAGALATREGLSLAAMVAAFDAGVTTALSG